MPERAIRQMGCGCGDCKYLDRVLLDKDSEKWFFGLKKDRRIHLERRLNLHKDEPALLTWDTVTSTRPHSLCIFKVNGEYEHHQWSKRFVRAQHVVRTVSGTPESLRLLLGERYDHIVGLASVTRDHDTSVTAVAYALQKYSEPERTRQWLQLCYERIYTSRVYTSDTYWGRSWNSVWDDYRAAFKDGPDPERLLGLQKFQDALLSTFGGPHMLGTRDKQLQQAMYGVRARSSVLLTRSSPSRLPLTSLSGNTVTSTSKPAVASSPSSGTKRKLQADDAEERRTKRLTEVIDLSADSP